MRPARSKGKNAATEQNHGLNLTLLIAVEHPVAVKKEKA